MKYTQEEIIKSLNIIRDICSESKNCNECPFRAYGGCNITNDKPEDWMIVSETTPWKAFE